MVEFAFVLPLFLMLVMLITDFGRAIWLYNNISNAAREGSRYAIIRTHTDDEIRTWVMEKGAGLPLTPADITISPPGTRAAKQEVTVTVRHTFTPITPLIGLFMTDSDGDGRGDLQLEGSSEMTVEH